MGSMMINLPLILRARKVLLLAAAILAICSNRNRTILVQAQQVSLKCDPCIDRPTYTVKVIVHGTESDLFWQQVRSAAVQSAKDMRVSLSFQLKSTFKPDLMANEIIAAVSGENRPDALIVTVPNKAVEDAVSAVSKHIPVFGFNSGYDVAEKAGILGFVAMDEYEGGVLAAEEFLSKKNIIQALFVNHEKGNSALDARFAGFKKKLEESSNSTVQVTELVIDMSKDVDIDAAFRGCSFDAVLLAGVASLELVTSLYYANSCSFSKNLLATFDINLSVYNAIAVGKLSFAVSQQKHLQGVMSILMATLYTTTGKKLAPSGDYKSGIYLSGPVVKTLSNLPSDTLQTCETDAFPVCPNTQTPDGKRESNCDCTDRKTMKIGGVVHGVTTDLFWDHVFAAARQAALDMDVELEMPRFEPVENDPSREILQSKMSSKMISLCQEGVDGLFVSLPGPDVFPAVRFCQNLSIPVLSINAGADYSKELGMMHHISQIEHSAGYGAGQRLIEKGMKRGVLLNHKPGRKDLEDRGWGLRDAINDAASEGADVTFLGIIDVPFDRNVQLKKLVEDAVDAWGNDWDGLGILLAGASLVEGALKIKEEHPEVIMASFDTSNEIFEAIDNGNLLLGIDQEPYLQGYMPVVLLTWFAQTGQRFVNNFIESGPALIESTPSADRQVCEATSFEVCPEPVNYEFNHLNAVRPVGFALFGIIIITSLGICGWVTWYHDTHIVQASQPSFLIMINVGTIILSCAIIPLSIDDGVADINGCNIACMAAPWLFFVGFTVAFSALFSKTWRLNRLIANAKNFTRVKLLPKDVILPFVILLGLNVTLLSIWTAVDPMYWERKSTCGSSELETYGTCTLGDKGSVGILSCILALNFVLVLLANYQAYQARKLTIEFDESKYVGLAMMSILQISIICLPVMFLANDNPEAKFIVQVCLIFVLCMSMLLLIFLPKILELRANKKGKNMSKMSKSGTARRLSSLLLKPWGNGLRVMSCPAELLTVEKVTELQRLINEQGIDSEPLFEKVGISIPEFEDEEYE